MEYRPFGATGLDVSAIGFGCWEIGGGYGSIEEQGFSEAIGRALDLGINIFDTAEGYGLGASEEALGRALGSRRDEAIVVSKFGVNYPDKPLSRDSSRERVFASIDKTLTFLGMDYVDVYYIHWPDRTIPFEETMTAVDEVVRSGKARFVGVSNFTRDDIATCMQTRRVDGAQYGYNMFDRRMERDILPYCEEQNIGFMAYGSLAYGLLTGTFTADLEFGADDWRSSTDHFGAMKPLFAELFGRQAFPRNVAAVDELKGVAAKYGKTIPQLALRWTTSNPVVSTSLVGCRNAAEVEDNVGALGWTIDAADLVEIDAIFARHGVNTCVDGWIEDIWRVAESRSDGKDELMAEELAGKVAIITGGASGIGRGTVDLFVAEGAKVVIADMNEELAGEAVAELGSSVAFKRTDVSDAAQVQALVDFTVEHFGGLDVMFNNAGIGSQFSRFLDNDLSDYDRVMAVDLWGVVIGSQYAARYMADHGGGSIINTSSIAATTPGAGPLVYRMAKTAVIQLTKSLAVDLGEYEIRVNCICPGHIKTPITSYDMEPVIRATQPLQRHGNTTDIANAVLFLASDRAAQITGIVVPIDGGTTAGAPPRQMANVLRGESK